MASQKDRVTEAAKEYQRTDKWNMTQFEAAEFARDVCDSRALDQDERFMFLVLIS